MGRFKIVTVIPAYNEEKTILKVIQDVKKYTDIIVVDDNSVDQTLEIAKKEKILVLKNYKNLGYEKTLHNGLFKAIELNYDYAITFDADGQHLPSDLEKFKKLINSGYDLVLGNRSCIYRFSERIAKKLFFKKWKIKDPFCGLKSYDLKKIKKFNFFERYSSVGTDLSLSFIQKGYKFTNVDIESFERNGKSKFGNIILGNYKILKSVFLSYFFH